MPVLNITTVAIVEPAVTAMPAQVTIPGGLLPAGATANIVIQGNGARPLALSEPRVNASGVEARLQEVQPGRSFILALRFPQGFWSEPGQAITASVNSNHPQFPTLTIPVIRLPSLQEQKPVAQRQEVMVSGQEPALAEGNQHKLAEVGLVRDK
jgi:hypothetical protein